MPKQHDELSGGNTPATDLHSGNLRSFQLTGLVLIVLATLISYLPALQGGFIWDDNAHVTRPDLRSLDGLRRIWLELGATQQYYPLLHSAFWLEYQLWSDNTLGYHLLNVLLHCTSVCLVFFILRRLAIPGALLAAAIFALHPVQVESVAWITEQKNTLSAVFYLSAMLAYLQFDQSRRKRFYAAALTLFILGLLCKTVTATLPAALLVIFWWQRGRLSWKRDVLPLVPFFIFGAIAGLFTAWVERNLIGAEGAPFELSAIQRGLLAGRVIWFYLGKLVWPTNLIFIYPRWDVDPAIWWQWIYPLAAIAVLVWLFAIHRRTRAPLAGWLFFVGTLFPVLGFFNVFPFLYSFVADHFQYLASLGIIVLAAAGIARSVSQLAPQARWIGIVGCVALVAVLGALTWQQAQMYSDVVTLYKTTIEKNPTCWMAYNNLGVQLAAEGNSQAALENYEQALQLKPDYAEAHFNLGNALFRSGNAEQAIEQYRQALQSRPSYPEAHNNLGRALEQIGNSPLAAEQYQEALRINPYYGDANYNLANMLAQADRLQEAIAHYQLALQNMSDTAELRDRLGAALANTGRLADAIVQFQAALQLEPDNLQTYDKLTHAYAQLNQSENAVATARKAIDLAQAKGQNALANTIEEWLKSYQAGQSKTSPRIQPQPVPTAP